MKTLKTIGCVVSALAFYVVSGSVLAEPKHGIAMNGDVALSPDFQHLPYVNPDAPKGGRIVYAEHGSFDSFNPFIVKGETPYGFKMHIYESFLKRSVDESFSLYGLLADTVDLAEDRSYVEFHLNPLAKFSDGTPVTLDDAMWSYETLAAKGHPKYARYMSNVTKMEKTPEGGLRFMLNTEDREIPLLIGLMPIMKKADFEGVEFDQGMLEPTIGSGAYVVGDYKMGSYISFKLNPDYWGKDLPINKGQNNLEEIKYVYFQDPDAMFEAFKAGEVNIFVEGKPARWDGYDFPLFKDGDVVKHVIAHQRPSGMDGFIFNTRRAPYDDWRVRQALIEGFNFAFVNETVNKGYYPRIESYFSNSFLGAESGEATGAVRALLEPFAAELPPGALEGYTLPLGDVSGRDREAVARATSLFEEAGFHIENGKMLDKDGKEFVMNVTVKTPEDEQLALLWADGLKPLGVGVNVEMIDGATHTERLKTFDYDVAHALWGLSLSPGNEQYLYWGKEAMATEGSRNYMGANEDAIDAMVDTMLRAQSQEDFVAAVQALDRILMSERYVVPFWFNPNFMVATDKRLVFPDYVPKFGYWQGYAPDAMYWQE